VPHDRERIVTGTTIDPAAAITKLVEAITCTTEDGRWIDVTTGEPGVGSDSPECATGREFSRQKYASTRAAVDGFAAALWSARPAAQPKPTIAELEGILARDGGKVEILPNGEVTASFSAEPDQARADALALAPLLTAPTLRMALAMQERLDANAHKQGWQDDSAEELHERLVQEMEELLGAIREARPDLARIRREAADVANFAMMIADVAGDLNRFDAEAEIGEALRMWGRARPLSATSARAEASGKPWHAAVAREIALEEVRGHGSEDPPFGQATRSNLLKHIASGGVDDEAGFRRVFGGAFGLGWSEERVVFAMGRVWEASAKVVAETKPEVPPVPSSSLLPYEPRIVDLVRTLVPHPATTDVYERLAADILTPATTANVVFEIGREVQRLMDDETSKRALIASNIRALPVEPDAA
jgi:NTP pyrophosphatase (non-canonical NTP hydrolase)